MGPYGKNKNTLTTPLARVRGLGSTGEGTGHYIAQRLSALALVPLTIWFVVSVIAHIGAPHYQFSEWAGGLCTATLLILTLIATFWHASLGLATVVEDYVHHELTKLVTLAVVKLACFGFALLGVLSVLKLALSRF
jgi:succinate dehydrogenase / fumarate reductase, membrane anchor subunit